MFLCSHRLSRPRPGDASVRCEQLDLLLQWGAEFKRVTSQSAGQEKGMEDHVAFEVVLGDLNFDNCSSGEFTDGKYVHLIHGFSF